MGTLLAVILGICIFIFIAIVAIKVIIALFAPVLMIFGIIGVILILGWLIVSAQK